MFAFVNTLKTIQAKTNYDLDRMGKGVGLEKPRSTPKQKLRRAHVVSLVKNYSGGCDKLQYLEALASHTGYRKKTK